MSQVYFVALAADNKLTEKVCGLDQLDLWIGGLGTDRFCNLTLSKYIGILKNVYLMLGYFARAEINLAGPRCFPLLASQCNALRPE